MIENIINPEPSWEEQLKQSGMTIVGGYSPVELIAAIVAVIVILKKLGIL